MNQSMLFAMMATQSDEAKKYLSDGERQQIFFKNYLLSKTGGKKAANPLLEFMTLQESVQTAIARKKLELLEGRIDELKRTADSNKPSDG